MRLVGTQIVFIGAGNVATHMAQAFYHAGIEIKAVYSRTIQSAHELAQKVKAFATNDITAIPESDIYIYCVKDDALSKMATINSLRFPHAMHIHTSGSTPADVFQSDYFGVIYPMQTFSKKAELDFNEVRCFIEGNNEQSLEQIRLLAESVSTHVCPLNSEARLGLHAAAVFACNFTNHCFTLAEKILMEKTGLPFKTIMPLIDETVKKVHLLPPALAQTGPAVRYDQNIIKKHLDMLKDDALIQEIYCKMSQSIHQTALELASDNKSTNVDS